MVVIHDSEMLFQSAEGGGEPGGKGGGTGSTVDNKKWWVGCPATTHEQRECCMVLGLQGREFGHWAVLLCVGPVETAATGLVEEMHWSLEESLGDTDQKSKVGVLLKEVVGQHFNRVNRHLPTPSKSLNFEAEMP